MSGTSFTRKEDISPMLKGIERYNPENLTRLELYVEEQAAENCYDLEANLAILKLYQFNPHCFRADVVVNILLKALTNLPHTDFVVCKCLIDMQLAEESEAIREVIGLHNQLETCHFKDFWVGLRLPVAVADSRLLICSQRSAAREACGSMSLASRTQSGDVSRRYMDCYMVAHSFRLCGRCLTHHQHHVPEDRDAGTKRTPGTHERQGGR